MLLDVKFAKTLQDFRILRSMGGWFSAIKLQIRNNNDCISRSNLLTFFSVIRVHLRNAPNLSTKSYCSLNFMNQF